MGVCTYIYIHMYIHMIFGSSFKIVLLDEADNGTNAEQVCGICICIHLLVCVCVCVRVYYIY